MPLSDTGRARAHDVLDQLSWWAIGEGFDAHAIDRACARFLAELDVEACPRCGDADISAKGLCHPCYMRAWRGKKSRKSI